MKKLSTLVKLATLFVIGGGTIGAAVGISEASTNPTYLEDGFVAQAAANLGLINGQYLIFEPNNVWKQDNAYFGIDFIDEQNKVNFKKMTKSMDGNYSYIQVPNDGILYKKIKFSRWGKEYGVEKHWGDSIVIDLTYGASVGANHFKMLPNWTYSWNFDDMFGNDDGTRSQCYLKDIISNDWKTGPIKTVENRNKYLDVYVNRQGVNDGLWVFNFKKNGKEHMYMPTNYVKYYDNYNGANKEDELAHYVVEKDLLSDSQVKIDLYKFKDSIDNAIHRYNWIAKTEAELPIGNTGKTSTLPVYDLDAANKVFYIEKQTDANNVIIPNKYYLNVSELKKDHYASKELAASCLEGIDSCLDDFYNGFRAITQLDKTFRFIDIGIDALKGHMVTDYYGTNTENFDKNTVTAERWSCYDKIEFLKGKLIDEPVPNKTNYVPNTANEKIIGVTVITGFAVLSIVGLVVVSKKKRLFK